MRETIWDHLTHRGIAPGFPGSLLTIFYYYLLLVFILNMSLHKFVLEKGMGGCLGRQQKYIFYRKTGRCDEINLQEKWLYKY